MCQISNIKNFALDNDVPIMQDEGIDFLCKFITEHKVHHILEIGSAIGYSAIRFASCNNDVFVDTVELDKTRYDLAVTNIAECGLSNKIRIFNDDGLTIDLSKLSTDYDLLFIDAAKAQYINFFNRFAPLVSSNGVIITDNLSFHGFVDNPELYHNYSTSKLVKKIQKYIAFLKSNPIYETVFYNFGDGVAVTTMTECAKSDRGASLQAQFDNRMSKISKYSIKSKKLELKPINMEDLFGLYSFLGAHNKNIQYMLFLPHSDLGETEDFIKTCQSQWDIFEPNKFTADYKNQNIDNLPTIVAYEIYYDNGLAGEVDVCFSKNDKNQIEAELGWIVSPNYQNRNIATKAARMLIRYFHNLGVNYFIAHIDFRNQPSKKVAVKLEMTLMYDNGQRTYKSGEKSGEVCYFLKF